MAEWSSVSGQRLVYPELTARIALIDRTCSPNIANNTHSLLIIYFCGELLEHPFIKISVFTLRETTDSIISRIYLVYISYSSRIYLVF